jgi:hypothetical protein
MAKLYTVQPEYVCEQCGSPNPIKVSAGMYRGEWELVTRFWDIGTRTVLAGTFHKPCVDRYIRENRI